MQIELSKREIQILNTLLDLVPGASITIKHLSELNDVSERMIKYDLDNIRFWIKNKKFQLKSKRNLGIWLEISDSERINTKNELREIQKINIYTNSELRVRKIMLLILMSDTPQTLQSFSKIMNVSKNTIVNDIDKIEEILEKESLNLSKKHNNKGFFISGDEKQKRLLMESIIQKDITEYEIYQIINQLIHTGDDNKKYDMLVGVKTPFQKEYPRILYQMSMNIDESMLNQINYNEILSVSIRLTIAIIRLKNEKTVGGYNVVSSREQSKLKSEKNISYIMMEKIFENYEFPILRDEYQYINSDIGDIASINTQDVMELTRKIIEKVSTLQKFPFGEDHQLFTNLFAHFSLYFSQKHQFINEYNPFSEELKERYLLLFKDVKLACEENIKNDNVFVNESFIAYVVLHFVVSKERYVKDTGILKVIYVCSTGLGVTSLIKQKINEKIKNLNIVGFASIINANEMINKTQPDLVISIFPIEGINCPIVKVSPIPDENDIKKIKQEIKKISSSSFENTEVNSWGLNNITDKTFKEGSKDILIRGFSIFIALKQLFPECETGELKDAFLLHVFLLVHRIIFNEQYQIEGSLLSETLLTNKKLVINIEKIFSDNNLGINHAEIIALLQYAKGDNKNGVTKGWKEDIRRDK